MIALSWGRVLWTLLMVKPSQLTPLEVTGRGLTLSLRPWPGKGLQRGVWRMPLVAELHAGLLSVCAESGIVNGNPTTRMIGMSALVAPFGEKFSMVTTVLCFRFWYRTVRVQPVYPNPRPVDQGRLAIEAILCQPIHVPGPCDRDVEPAPLVLIHRCAFQFALGSNAGSCG